MVPVSEMTYCVEWDVKLYYTTLCPKKTVVPNFGDNFVKS